LGVELSEPPQAAALETPRPAKSWSWPCGRSHDDYQEADIAESSDSCTGGMHCVLKTSLVKSGALTVAAVLVVFIIVGLIHWLL
jgi:hypothetical protein